jgi:poly-gamma-glutamate capsule biosynthesis protein CapA/YwtB (metallophosphatase superfamily)
MARSLTLAIAGDVMLGRLVNAAIAQYGPAYPWDGLVPLLRQPELFLVNLECALTRETALWHDGEYKVFYFRADPVAVETLRIGRVDFVSLANNHTLDFGAAGLLETIAVLDQAGIAHAGAGADLAAARRPARLQVGDTRVSVVAFADYPEVWAATPTTPGINYTPVSLAPQDFAAIERALAEARTDADLVVFSIHWGPNMCARPTEAFRAFARRVIEAGADLFWGHSAHVVQGIEIWQGKPILYDTGDFVDDYAVDAALRNDLSALFLVEVTPPAVTGLRLVPVHIRNCQVTLAKGADREWFVRRITELCAEMGTRVVAGPEALEVALPAPAQSTGGAAS